MYSKPLMFWHNLFYIRGIQIVMKKNIAIIIFLLLGTGSFAQDTTFWEHSWDYEVGQKEIIERDWGREIVCYLGDMIWKTPSGKEMTIRIITSYQQITKANGFNDQSLIALVKPSHEVIKVYDLVKRHNLPIEIRENQLVYKPNGEDGEEILSALPVKFGSRFCVKGLTCFDEFIP